MPPKKSQVTAPPPRNLRFTARKSVVAAASPGTTLCSVDHQNANQVEKLRQQRERNSSDYCHAGPTTADVNLPNSGLFRPEISSEQKDDSVKIVVHSGPGGHEGDGEMGVERESLESERVGLGSVVRPSGNNNSVQFLGLPGPLRPEIGDAEMGVERKSLESEGAGLGSVRPEVDSYSAGVEPKNTGTESVRPVRVANAVNGGNESLKEEVTTNVGGSSGKRKVMKRVVRVVRKVVRKKVPKRVAEGVDEERKNDNLETTGCVSGSKDAKNASSSGIDRIGIENSKPNGSVVAEAIANEDSRNTVAATSVVKEHSLAVNHSAESKDKESKVKEDSSGLGEVKMVVEKSDENFEAAMNVSESMVIDKEDSGGLKEMVRSKNKNAVLLEVKNEGLGNTMIKSKEIEKYSSVVDGNAETENEKKLEVTGPMGAKRLEDQFGSNNEDSLQKLHVSDKTDVVEAQDVVPVVESSSGEGSKAVKEPLEDDSARLGQGLVWSGEMEALERRKRRKTEIFVGGLDKDAKEEDVKKVFEDVGEIVKVTLVMNGKTGKNKGFAFVRYASAADAKKALTKYSTVEICGKECSVTPVEGNDTLFLGNINRKWKSEDIVKLLKEAGIQKIDKVTVIADPNNVKCNRGFAFVELETCKDAQSAFHKLQAKGAFGRHQQIKVAWAEPLIEPDEEEVLKVKSVYAEYLPFSWGEEEVKNYFKRFGEIENVTLAKSLHSSRRKDFAFVNYTSREAAFACVKAFNQEQTDNDGLKVKVKVSLAKPTPKNKQTKQLPNVTTKELPKKKRKGAERSSP